MSKKRKPKIPFKDVPIVTYAPLSGQSFAAMFKGLPMIFHGATEQEARDAASQWREDEMAKEARKAANAKAASERMKARAET